MNIFNPKDLKKLYHPPSNSDGEDNGQVTIIGGSKLFHGAPLLSLKATSRIVDMVFFTSPELSVGGVAERIKSKLLSFIWVPLEEVEEYIEKSDAVLIGPGFMRFSHERDSDHVHDGECDQACELTRNLTKTLLQKFPQKRWVIDAGSLQTMDPAWIPPNSILTPNKKEFAMLFKIKVKKSNIKVTNENLKIIQDIALRYRCVIVLKGPETVVCSSNACVVVKGGNAGMTKGGTGDVQAGLTVALLAKNEPFLAASAGAYLVKSAADALYKKVGTSYNADDLADYIPHLLQF